MSTEKRDIENREDLKDLLRAFYENVIPDEEIGYFFTEVVPLNLEKHLPVIADFWESVLFNNNVYQGNPMQLHMNIHKKSPLEDRHFDRWLTVFCATVDAYFVGERAETAKQRARSVANIMRIKIHQAKAINKRSHDNSGSTTTG